MNPSPVKGKTRRKPCTENPSARFDEEAEVERPLLYSTASTLVLMLSEAIRIQNNSFNLKIRRAEIKYVLIALI